MYYVYIYVCMYVLCIHIRVCMYVLCECMYTCATGQSPHWAVAPLEEEEECMYVCMYACVYMYVRMYICI